MKNRRLKLAYNVQLVVESEYLVTLDIIIVKVVMDYENEENYKHLEDHNLSLYIKPANCKQTKMSSFKFFTRKNREYEI